VKKIMRRGVKRLRPKTMMILTIQPQDG
jgi:hypothetical protein